MMDFSKQRTEPTAPDIRLKVQVWIFRHDTQNCLHVLLLRLIPERGDFWQPVTGGVEQGESSADAALREAAEETSLEWSDDLIDLNYSFAFSARGFQYEENVYAIEARNEAVKLDPVEHTDFRWVRADEAEKELKYPSNAEGLRRLLVKLKKGKSR